MTPTPDWHLVVPVKGGASAKSRLHPPTGVGREALALALATDCLTACCAGMPPARVLVVTSDERVAQMARGLDARVVADPGAGLNAAVRAGRDAALADGPSLPVAALLGDLPALRAEDLTAALGAAAAYPLAVVPDAAGEGTVLLTALTGAELVPSFGAGSAARHEAAGHQRLELELPRLRTDVDDDADLQDVLALGVGAATRRALEQSATTLPPMQGSVHSFDETTGAGSALLDDGREVTFTREVFAASALRHLRVGQRLSLDLTGEREVSKLWIVGIGDDQRIG
ncbi:2-phospho-L-lactate guanylyltransferase [Pedococcus bigeumensis]|uniref:Phosphoenolpyruvate guanylyltransferase n=1 Tax=Pedococcus bigeumensis TaxID=433644 RepID=A0A502CU74_9MICO|nr:2-phospho-L-lactate guanylyltransferase [Pedococcus bigeumensis]TPG16363.1 2-phospho-L-lactate guanylyltransferase [Pedococcus bigeumensis]